MYDAVIAKEACSLEAQQFVPGEVVSIHRDGTAARNAADKANKRKGEYGLFVAVHSESLVKKGDLREDLLNQYELNERRGYGKRLMRAILSDELTGKRNVMADDAGYHLQHLGITLEDLKEWYEEEVRAEHLEQQIRSQEHAHLRARGFEAQKAIDEIRNQPCFAVPAVRGIQAGQEYFLAQIPYPILARLFVFDEEEAVPAELRAQRALNKKRAESISEYMLDNRDTYVLPALTASVDKAMAFEALEGIEQLGTLHIPMSATMLINDGQHRRLAIEMALRNDETLRHETAPVQIHFDQGLQRSQQIFADINSKAVKPSSAINALYDHRNPYNTWLQDLLTQLPAIKRKIDFENGSPGMRSPKLWSLVAFKKFVTLLTGLSEKTITGLEDEELMDCADLVREFLEGCEKYIPQWGDMLSGKIAASDVRENFVIGHAVFLEALGMFGREALFYGTHLSPQEKNAKVVDPGKAKWHVMRPLEAVQPSKSDGMWENRCVVLGKMQKTVDGTKATAAQLLSIANIPLPESLAELHQRIIK